ncbi:MAG: hypothetical protein CEE38_02545 [Planctomycetes bacterium B3_Pla]|nr:MAG: hypothetical protein CEE38_02545 [Planctomycetes bacterium B3_Pla]
MKRLLTICAVVLAISTMTKAAIWHVPGDFATIQEAIDSGDVMDGDTIIVGPGSHAGATVTKAVEIKGEYGAVINSGPAYSIFVTGFYFRDGAGNGATISNLSFEIVGLAIYSRDTDDVTVVQCTFTSPVQGITNWNGNGWNISHNVINGLRTLDGGGIGIFVGTREFEGATANNNLIAHNKVTGQVVVPQDEIDRYNDLEPYPVNGYTVAGIDLYSDRRYGPAGPITGNRILKNKVSISSNNPRNHPADGIGLTDFGLNQESPVADIVNNKVGFNDVRGVTGTSSTPISLWPDPVAVADNNVISRNLGDDANNRGGGAHPKALFD